MLPPLTAKEPALIRLLTFIFAFFLIIALLSALALFIQMVHFLFEFNELVQINRPFTFQVFLNEALFNGVIQWDAQQQADFHITTQVGQLQINQAHGRFLALNNFFHFLIAIAVIVSMLKATEILNSAKSGHFLLSENAARLKWIVMLNLLALGINQLSFFAASWYFDPRIAIEHDISLGVQWFSFGGVGMVLWSIFFIIITEVFRIGATLKREHDLTI